MPIKIQELMMAQKITRGELTRQYIQQSDAIEKISKLNRIFSRLGTNPRTNIDIIVQHTCELLKGVCSLYNRLDNDKKSLIAWADHNLPPDFNREDKPDGHICYEVTMNEKDKPIVIGDIGKTVYQDTDTNVKKYGLKSYLGFPVALDGNTIGALCVVDVEERDFSDTEIHIISTLAKALSLEEERQRAEEELRESEKMHRLLAENARDMIFRRSLPGGGFEYISSASIALTGYKPEELYNKPLLFENIVHPDSRECFKKQWRNIVNGAIASHYEYKIITKTGETKWVYQRSVLIVENKTGYPIAVEGIISDVTNQKLAEMILKESEIKHKTLVKNIPGMVYRAYPDWSADVVSGSEAVCGYTKNELASKKDNWLSIIHPDERETVLHEGSELINAPQDIVQTYRIKAKDGGTRWVEDRKTSIFSDTGEFIGIDGVIFDITDRKKAEDELNRTNERLEAMVKERTSEIVEKNITLKVLMDQREEDSKKFEESILANVKELIMPNLIRLKNSRLTGKQQVELNVLEANLNEIISPFASKVSSSYLKLTPTEFQVANFIKHGASSKDISESLGLSQRTVDTHRYNIRKKLGIRGKDVNLRTYLSSLT